jgi:hypothetical protein
MYSPILWPFFSKKSKKVLRTVTPVHLVSAMTMAGLLSALAGGQRRDSDREGTSRRGVLFLLLLLLLLLRKSINVDGQDDGGRKLPPGIEVGEVVKTVEVAGIVLDLDLDLALVV